MDNPKLIEFRVRKYKRIDDSGPIKVGNLEVFVGRNEVGKSSLFEALSKLNNLKNVGFTPVDDMPHHEYTKLSKTVIPITATFLINGEKVTVCKNYNNDTFKQKVDGKWAPVDIDKFLIPKFIYFDKYNILDARINLHKYSNRDEEGDEIGAEILRIQDCFFGYCNIDVEKLIELEPAEKEEKETTVQKIKERAIICDSAANTLTKGFNDWWKIQDREYEFEFTPDDKWLQIRVADTKEKSRVALNARSLGLQYFISFFIIFLVESKDEHENSILLLDEPGLHYHGTMQLQLIDFFKKLSIKNQIFYTTHSPFLVDQENYDGVKIVHDDEQGKTIIAPNNKIPYDEIALFPLKINWLQSVFQDYIKNKTHLLVEGRTDYLILNKVNNLMSDDKKINVVIVSGKGTESKYFLQLLLQHELSVVFLVDDDIQGNEYKESYENIYHLKGCSTKNFTNSEKSSIEDIIPQDIYLEAFIKIYRIATPTLNPESMITKQLEEILKKDGRKFNKLRVTEEVVKLFEKNQSEIITSFEKLFEELKDTLPKDGFEANLHDRGEERYAFLVPKEDLKKFIPNKSKIILSDQIEPIEYELSKVNSLIISDEIKKWCDRKKIEEWDLEYPPAVIFKKITQDTFKVIFKN